MMAWFERMRRRLRDYTSDGDYVGSHGSGASAEREIRNAKARFETTVNPPDRFGGGGGHS
jgi:hypothetical protein